MFAEPKRRPPGSGLHPDHYSALRHEILRTGSALSREQLKDLAEALGGQVRQRREDRKGRTNGPDAYA